MSRIAVVSVAVSVAVMLVALAVILGFKREVTARMVGFSAPVEVIDGAGIYAAESRPVAATARFEALLRAVDGVQRATPYAVKSGIVRTRDAMEGVALKGVDGSYDWSFFAGRLTEGRLPRVGDSLRTKELLLSARTARLLGVHAGDKVEMLFVAGDERPRRDRFKVSGLYSTGMEELERTALTDLRNVQRLSGWSSGEVSGYDLFLGDVRQADRLAEAVNDALLRSDLPETDGVVAVSVGERYPAVFDWLKAHDVNAAVVIAVMVAVAFFNMASALLILVLERTRMIGLLKAMGMENRRIRRIFLYRAAFIVGRGLLWGNLAAGLLCWFQARFHLLRLDPAGYMLSEVPVAVSAGWWLAVDVAAAGAILALLLVPCVRGPYPPRRSDQNRLIMKPYDTELSKKEEVRAMFDNIAPAYDRLNHTLSLSVDRIWRRRVVRIVGRLHPRRVLDMATGTGDLAVMMARSIPEAHIKGVDLSEGMLDVARRKVAARGLEERVTLEAGDAETAVAAAGSVDVVTVAFGVRNFGDLGRGLAELSRALRPGGRIVILEFSTPTMPVFGRLYDWYSHRVLPRIGGWLSHDRQAYDYLPRSVDEFPQPEEFLTILAAAGFRDCRARSQSFGIAQIYTAEKC